ncbi:MAG: hypothetical protein E6G39_12065 [Actinobacteria bacterium]|nr:MAG: hypothetical protein E6G39_12065 [Actinomycetota bacterium]
MDEWGLVPEDDMFHPPESDDPWWTETVWFSWMVPERNLLGYWYAVFRPNIGVNFGGVLVFDHTAVLPWEIPIFDWHWHQPISEPVDLCDLNVLGGMTLRCEEHGRRFRFGYQTDDVSFDLTYDALMQPMLTRKEPPFNHGNHIDQPGRVTGRFMLYGEEMSVDCIAMRDRSWGIRAPRRQPKLGYCHATNGPDSSFLTISIERKGHDGIVAGYLMRDGEWAKVVSGVRNVTRDAKGRPAEIRVEAVDERGRALEAIGTTVSRQVFTAYPDMFCWNSLARWDFDSGLAWGEDQDIWHPRKWRAYASEIGALIQ